VSGRFVRFVVERHLQLPTVFSSSSSKLGGEVRLGTGPLVRVEVGMLTETLETVVAILKATTVIKMTNMRVRCMLIINRYGLSRVSTVVLK
jgi:hypothetical protein